MLTFPFARRSFAVSVFLLLVLVMSAGVGFAQNNTHAIISQIYAAGGNNGAVLNADYVEIFNPTGNTLTLNNYSIQYASAGGASISTVTILPATITLAPGQYYLIAGAPGSNGAALPVTADAPSTNIAFGATAGKVALVNSTTRLATACSTSDPSLVDFVAYGSGTNCALGSAAPAPSTTKADVRTNVCTISNNSGLEFAALDPAPHNSASTPFVCGAPTPLAVTGQATPSTVFSGNSVLLTATVTPATQPVSSGITVAADLSSIGGSAAQPFFDDGTNGDVTAGDNIFSYNAPVSAVGTFTLPVTASDSQLRTAHASIALTVATPPPTVSIKAIQAAKPSPYATQTVTTSGIVIGVKSNGFYLEAKDADTNPTSPEGILVYTGSTTKPSFIAVGNEVEVTGVVSTYPTTSLTPGTEIDGPQTFTLLSTNRPLPEPVKITAAMDSPSGGIFQFTRFEGMRVAIDSFTTTSGTDASLNEATEINTSNGRFYGVVTGVQRPFREPGISVTDTAFGPVPPGVPRWDSNPELLYLDSLVFGAPPINLTSNTTLTGVVGVMDFSFGSPEILIDAATRPTVTGGMTVQPVPAQASNEFTVTSFNMERFYNDKADADNPGSSAVTVTPEAYQRRLTKASLAIRTILNTPDIIGTQEIENLAVLTDLAHKISDDAVASGRPDPLYTPYLFLANDGTAINTGFLVKSTRVNTLNVEQIGLNTTFTNSQGNQAILNDRTPLVLHAGIKRGGSAPDYPVTVISVHQRSLINVDDPTSTGATVRLKREAQAEFLAKLIQGYQAAGEHVVTVGDYNSFEFSDGFVDVLGVTRGNPVPASEVVTPPVAGLANPPLVDLVTLLPADQRQSYVETGSAQVLDHVLVTSDLVPTNTRLVYAHIDSDFPLVNLNDATSPTRISDHDPAVAYFTVPAVQGTVKLITTAALSTTAGGYQALVTVTNSGTGTAQNVKLTSMTLGSAVGSPVPAVLGDIQPGASAVVAITFPVSAGVPGAATVEKITGTYTGGSFGGSLRATLPVNP